MTEYEQYYQTSIEAVTKLIKETKEIPTEKAWNRLARDKGYLTSQSITYISQERFADVCKRIYKEIQQQKREKKANDC